MNSNDYQHLSQRIKLLSHPERLRLLDVLRRQPECVCHLEALLEKPQPYVSQQLRVLREAGVISAERDGQNLYYQLSDMEVGRWLNAVLGQASGEYPELIRHKQLISCACPQCATGIEVSFHEQNITSEVSVAKRKLIFICTGNSARSQMAEAFLRHHAADQFEAYSAGLEPHGLNPYTVRVMQEVGIPMDDHISNDVRDYLGKVHFGHVVTVCGHAEENCPRAWLAGSNHLHWAFEDPAAFQGSEEETLIRFRAVRDQIEQKILMWLAETA